MAGTRIDKKIITAGAPAQIITMQENTALGAIAVVPGAGGTVTVKYGLDDYQNPDASAQFDAVLESNAGVIARGTVAVAANANINAAVQYLKVSATVSDAVIYVSLGR